MSTRQAVCAHCGDEQEPRGSKDYGKAYDCPACGKKICPSCRAKSGPTICGSFADGDENMAEIYRTEKPRHRQSRKLARRNAQEGMVKA